MFLKVPCYFIIIVIILITALSSIEVIFSFYDYAEVCLTDLAWDYPGV